MAPWGAPAQSAPSRDESAESAEKKIHRERWAKADFLLNNNDDALSPPARGQLKHGSDLLRRIATMG